VFHPGESPELTSHLPLLAYTHRVIGVMFTHLLLAHTHMELSELCSHLPAFTLHTLGVTGVSLTPRFSLHTHTELPELYWSIIDYPLEAHTHTDLC
jgi:hypothetical protein